MAKTVDFDIVGSYNNQRVTPLDAERSVNLFEYRDPLGKKQKSLINTSGLLDSGFVFTGATGGFRAEFYFNGDQYMVIGGGFYKVTGGGTESFLGSLVSTTSGFVGIDANTFQIIFVDGQNGYIWDTMANTFTVITDASFTKNPIDVTYLDGFFVVAEGGTNNFQLSSFNQGLVWGPASNAFTTAFATNNQLTIGASTIGGDAGTINYATGVPVQLSTTGSLPAPLAADTTYYVILIDPTHIELATSYANAIAGTEIVLTTDGTGTQTITSLGQLQQGSITSHPGTIVACRTLHRRLFLFSQFFTEVWENAGIGTNLPFRRNNSFLIEYGTPAIGSIWVDFDMLIFLSQTRGGLGPVMQINGTQPIMISNRALDFQLAQYAALQQIADCRSFIIKENGLIFYRMNFTAANHTFVYNVTLSDPTQEQSKMWHEEEILNGDRHPAQTHVFINGLNYVGDYLKPTLYQVDSQTFTNNGEPIRRMRITKAIVPPGYQRIRVDRLQIDLLQGNVDQIGFTSVELDLFTENGFQILTEAGDNIELEQALTITQPPMQPYVFLSLSRDGGQTYGYEIKAPMGKVGQRAFRTLWRKLGTFPRGQAVVFKFECYDEIPFVILGASWAFEVLPE